jgi:hypothetical protein
VSSPAADADTINFPGPDPGQATPVAEDGRLTLENAVISASWRLADIGLRIVAIADRLSAQSIASPGEAFVFNLGDGRAVKASQMKVVGPPRVQPVKAQPDALCVSQRADGIQISVDMADKDDEFRVEWRAVLRNGANYIRQIVTVQSVGRAIPVESITLVDLDHRKAMIAGSVMGSPVVAGGMFFAYEHPNALSQVTEVSSDESKPTYAVRCKLERNVPLVAGQPLIQSSVMGVAPPGQMRRAFLYYIERERPRPYKPFLHYNSWYDIAWADRKMNEDLCLATIECFGRHLTREREVALDCFVFDDGWDDNKTLWRFHEGFPDGFTPLRAAAEQYDSSVGVWLSPWGGYGRARAERMEYGKSQGFETNRNGFSLAGPKYFARFRDVCAEMIERYDVNYFKFDGVGIGNNQDGASPEFLPDIEGLLRLCAELRRLRPDIYLSITTGTWPSPFWLFHGDSIWRNGADCGFHGAGPMRQQWITYRDMITYRMIHRRAPLYPVNSLMVQGICYAQLGTATKMGNELKDMVDEIRMLFACGTQLQELYVTPQMMTPPMWDALAEATRWSRRNADVLVDVHWIGGDPGEGQPYGYASWSPRMGIVSLRNPDEAPAQYALDIAKAFELPEGAPRRYRLSSPWKGGKSNPPVVVEAGRPHNFDLPPFETMVLEAMPIPSVAEIPAGRPTSP